MNSNNENQYGLEITNPIKIWNKHIQIKPKDIFVRIGKMVISGLSFNWGGIADNAIETLSVAGLKDKPGEVAWVLIFQSLIQAICVLVNDNKELLKKTISEERLEHLSEELEQVMERIELRIDNNFFKHPQNLPLLFEFREPFVRWLRQVFELEKSKAEAISYRLPDKFVFALHDQWLKKPDYYVCIKDEVNTPFTNATDEISKWMHYTAWLKDQVNVRMFNEAFSLQQVYVPLRAYY